MFLPMDAPGAAQTPRRLDRFLMTCNLQHFTFLLTFSHFDFATLCVRKAKQTETRHQTCLNCSAQLNTLFQLHSGCIYESFTGLFRISTAQARRLCLSAQHRPFFDSLTRLNNFSAVINFNDITFTLV